MVTSRKRGRKKRVKREVAGTRGENVANLNIVYKFGIQFRLVDHACMHNQALKDFATDPSTRPSINRQGGYP